MRFSKGDSNIIYKHAARPVPIPRIIKNLNMDSTELSLLHTPCEGIEALPHGLIAPKDRTAHSVIAKNMPSIPGCCNHVAAYFRRFENLTFFLRFISR